MADSDEQFLMENLKQFVYNAKVIIEVKDKVESLYKELRNLEAFPMDHPKKKREYEIVKYFVRQIRNAASAAENFIDTFAIQAEAAKNTKKQIEGEEDVINNKNKMMFDSDESLQVAAAGGSSSSSTSKGEDVIDAFAMQAAMQKPCREADLFNHPVVTMIHKASKQIEEIRGEEVKEIHDNKNKMMFDSDESLQVAAAAGSSSSSSSSSSKEEDVIDAFAIQAAAMMQKSLLNHPVVTMIHKAPKQIEIEEIRGKVKEIHDKKTLISEALQVTAGSSSKGGGTPVISAPVVEEDNNVVVVGFDKEISMLVDRLTVDQEEKLEIISVIGRGGLGKTTLAREVYRNPKIEGEFYYRAWVYVSEEYNRRDVLLGILACITYLTDEMYRMNNESLAEEIRQKLQGRKYLIVLDNICTTQAWDDFKLVFPNNNNKSRVMLTSRDEDVANSVYVHNLRVLNDDESSELLRKVVFLKGSCPRELAELGKEIAEECKGLPLAIVVVAGLLIHERVSHWWKRVAQYVRRDSLHYWDVLSLSYNRLHENLKPCFLYFGIFPGNFEIPVRKLFQLWVAEGFIPGNGKVNLEDIAEEYLEDLVDRNLVMVEKRRFNGRIKTCRVHDMLHDLCLKEAAAADFFKKTKLVPNSSLSPTENKNRHLCCHSNVLGYISSKTSAPHACCLLCFSLEEIELPLAHIQFISDSFKLIKVLDIKHINLPRFPSEIIQLIHLRYIALAGDFNVLPASISKLLDTQTLIVDTSSPTLDIKADIWKMLNLRHLYTSASTQLPGPTKGRKNEDSGVESKIETMFTISPESCTENVLGNTPNLKKLGIRGKLLSLLEVRSGSNFFNNLAQLKKVETMKLLDNTFSHPPLRCKLPGLPQGFSFPPNLKKLTLSNTLLSWEHMGTLGTLGKLEVLKLKDNAFTGWRWQSCDGGFQLLKVLHIGKTDLGNWNASANHFPSLQHLVIRDCAQLEEIPSSFGNISTLQTMELYRPTSVIADSARKIMKQRQQMQQEHSSVNSGFKLTIYHPDV